MNDKKICFIRCINNDTFAAEQDYYFSRMTVPEGFETELLSITDAPSICAGYNEGMNASDAKYKVYLHQDVFIYNKNFLLELLEVFKDPAVGMFGLVGTTEFSPGLVPWESPRIGHIICGIETGMMPTTVWDTRRPYEEVKAIDGLLMATQVDIPWREDLFKGWDMYDMSQSLEMRRAGYKVVIPRHARSWAVHDEDLLNLSSYFEWLEVFRKEYEKDIVDSYEPVNVFDKPVILCIIPPGGNSDLYESLKLAGYNVRLEKKQLHPSEENPQWDERYLECYYGNSAIEAVVSWLFIPAAAEFCHKRDIPYISWVYDSPQQSLYSQEALYGTNRIFVFDRTYCEKLRLAGVQNVFYRPLAANINRTDIAVRRISSVERMKLGHDISFVGSLYNEDNYMAAFEALEGESADIMEKYYTDNLCIWEDVRPWPRMPEDLCEEADKGNSHGSMPSDVFYGTAVMSRKLARLERIKVLNHLAKKHNVDLYTNSSTAELSMVRVHPGVDYNFEAPKVYNLSKINLNLTLPSIETGIPQRIFDIMAAGGFVLTNHQKEMEELFDIDSEIVTFKSLDELTEKVDHYLSHEKERQEIAQRGRRKIAELYDMKKVAGEIYESVRTH